MKQLVLLLTLSLFSYISEVIAQPMEFTPEPCDENFNDYMKYNLIVGEINGETPTTNDMIGVIDEQGFVVAVSPIIFGDGLGCTNIYVALLNIAGQQTDVANPCQMPLFAPPYGGSINEALDFVAYQASSGLFFSLSFNVPYQNSAANFPSITIFGASGGNCASLNFTEPYTFSPPTPVTLLSFRASAVGGQRVALDWVTGTEQNSSHFEIQHATNGRSWETIGRVAAAGESNSRLEYSFQHLGAAPGQNMYRLRQVDFDGTFDFSPVVLADLQGDKGPRGLRVFPNPAIGQVVTLSLEGEWSSESRSTLYDINGRQVAEWIGLQSGSTTLELPPLPAGIYQLVSRDRSASVSERIVLR